MIINDVIHSISQHNKKLLDFTWTPCSSKDNTNETSSFYNIFDDNLAHIPREMILYQILEYYNCTSSFQINNQFFWIFFSES